MINFENNLLRTVAIPQFVFLPRLREINLRRNKLREVPQFGFYLRNLKTFDVSENEIDFAGFINTIDSISLPDFLSVHIRMHLYALPKSRETVLNLSRNTIEQIDLHVFNKTRLDKLEILLKVFEINLTGNPLNCDCKTRELQLRIQNWTKSEGKITEKDFESWVCQTPVNLSGMKILNVPPDDLRCEKFNSSKCPKQCTSYHQSNSDSIRLIDCRRRNLTEVPKNLPNGMFELRLEHNQIEKLTLSKTLGNVTILYASHNKIHDVYLKDFPIELKEIYLDSNKLTTLPKHFQNLTLSRINLQNNYFICDCKNQWMKNWLKRKRNAFVGGVESVRCSSGGGNQGKPLVFVNARDFVCAQKIEAGRNSDGSIHNTSAISSYVVAGFLFLIIIMAVLLHRFRKELKLILYTRFNWHPFDRVDDSDPSKIYDAFVSFNMRDKVWVEQTLQEKLEKGNPPYKLCVHYRDFIPGAPIAETILDCVKKSRRMIMVLSRNFIGISLRTFESLERTHELFDRHPF